MRLLRCLCPSPVFLLLYFFVSLCPSVASCPSRALLPLDVCAFFAVCPYLLPLSFFFCFSRSPALAPSLTEEAVLVVFSNVLLCQCTLSVSIDSFDWHFLTRPWSLVNTCHVAKPSRYLPASISATHKADTMATVCEWAAPLLTDDPLSHFPRLVEEWKHQLSAIEKGR